MIERPDAWSDPVPDRTTPLVAALRNDLWAHVSSDVLGKYLWDVANAIRLIEQRVPNRDGPILDMGCFKSEILYALHKMGDRQVHGCDLNPLCRWMPYWNKIHYRASDITKTPYPDRSFVANTCMAVVEHGVPLDPLADEVYKESASLSD
jgi:2-polyprenyl-3-methyl-5-hydroxy-6-metoxy-1,4-benzoquinol methylase